MVGEDTRYEKLLKTDVQRRTFEEMTRGGKQLFRRIADKVVNLGRTEVLVRWEIGQLVSTAIADVKRYGERIVEQLSVALGSVTVDELYKYRQFAEQFDQDTVVRLLAARTSGGRQITWSHFRALLALEKAPGADGARKEILQKIFDEDLSVPQTTQAVQEFFGIKRSKGRAPTPPKTVQAAIQQMRRHQEALVNRAAGWVKVVADVRDLPASRCDEKLLADLRETLNIYQEQLMPTVQSLIQYLKETLESVEKFRDQEETEPVRRETSPTPTGTGHTPENGNGARVSKWAKPSVPPPLPPLTKSRLEAARQAFRRIGT